MFYELIKEITNTIFEKDLNNHQQRLMEINRKHKELTNSPIDGFLFEGAFLRPTRGEILVGSRSKERPPLHKSLHKDMKMILAELDRIAEDRQKVTQILSLLALKCKTNQELRDTLPECLVVLCPSIKDIPRVNQPAYTIQDNPRFMKQYNKVLPLIEEYAGMRLFIP